MRGRKQTDQLPIRRYVYFIKKESPNEGTETFVNFLVIRTKFDVIKKESPNEGTETKSFRKLVPFPHVSHKKRIPE